MNNKTLTALKQSIQHWERLASGKRENSEGIFSKDCPLCKMFFEHRLTEKCVGCPVMEETGFSHCQYSPWEEALQCALDPNHNLRLNTPRFRSAAKKELAFLKSLLPNKSK